MRESCEFQFLLEYLELSVRGMSKILKFFMAKVSDLSVVQMADDIRMIKERMSDSSVAEMADDIRMIRQFQNEILFRVRDIQCPSCVSLDTDDLERN